ncbi:DUF6233 domain-containing protein [Streptomyces sp. NPDC004393]
MGDCWTARKSSRCVGISRTQALDALRQQVSARTHCRADTALGFMDLPSGRPNAAVGKLLPSRVMPRARPWPMGQPPTCTATGSLWAPSACDLAPRCPRMSPGVSPFCVEPARKCPAVKSAFRKDSHTYPVSAVVFPEDSWTGTVSTDSRNGQRS